MTHFEFTIVSLDAAEVGVEQLTDSPLQTDSSDQWW